jgi:hypothetical protein
MNEAGETLRSVDFMESGVQSGVGWAVKVSREHIKRIAGQTLTRTGNVMILDGI